MSLAPVIEQSVVQFDEASHTYTLDGERILSVTQILAEAGLTDWSHCSEWAKERGSLVHKAIHLELTAGLDWSSVPEAFHPYISAELQAIADLGAVVVESELRLFSRSYWYAGTLDRVVLLGDDLALWDTKTGPIVPAYGLQTAAYAEAYQEMTGRRIKRRYALRLKLEGTYELEPFTDRNDIVNFHAAVRVANWRRQKGLSK